jgi:hypothetical protein
MNRGFAFIGQANPMRIATRKQRLMAIKAMIVYLERISDAERRQMNTAQGPVAACGRYESELLASVIDEAVFILDTLSIDRGTYE